LARWGSDGLAFRTTAGDLVLLAGSFGACESDAECDDLDGCTTDACVGGTCVHTAMSCGEDICSSGACDPAIGCARSPASAGTACGSDQDACTDDMCDGAGRCNHLPVSEESLDAYTCSLDNIDAIIAGAHRPICAGKCPGRITSLVSQTRSVLRRAGNAHDLRTCARGLRAAHKSAGSLVRTIATLQRAGKLVPPELGGTIRELGTRLRDQLTSPTGDCRAFGYGV